MTKFNEKEIASKARRKIKSRHFKQSPWSGLGMMGLIGWSIVIPTLIGAALGWWLDTSYQAQNRWTLALMTAGLVLGCFNAWKWIADEERAIKEEEEKSDE